MMDLAKTALVGIGALIALYLLVFYSGVAGSNTKPGSGSIGLAGVILGGVNSETKTLQGRG